MLSVPSPQHLCFNSEIRKMFLKESEKSSWSTANWLLNRWVSGIKSLQSLDYTHQNGHCPSCSPLSIWMHILFLKIHVRQSFWQLSPKNLKLLLFLPMPAFENDTNCQMYCCHWTMLVQHQAVRKKVGINYACVYLVLGWAANSAEAVLAASSPWEFMASKRWHPIWCENPCYLEVSQFILI